MEKFEKALKNHLLFKTNKGNVRTEDLFDLSLEELDSIAQTLNKEIKEKSELSFIKKKTDSNLELELKFDIVKHIIETRLQEIEDRKNQQAVKEEKNRLLEILAKKESQDLENLSADEIRKRIEQLDKK